MKAAILESVGSGLTIVDDVELAPTGVGEVRVRIHWCGLCHSDVSQIDGTHPAMCPTILGHEAAGEVIEVGVGVTTLAVGDHVVLTPAPSCGHCYWCIRGKQSICVNASAIAMSMLPDGSTRLSRGGGTVFRGLGLAAMAEEVVVAEAGAVKIPADVPLDVACIIGCAVQTGVGAALHTAEIEAGATVLVMGAGGIGVSIVQGAVIAGAARIIVSDPVASRRELAQSFGATDVIDPTSTDVANECHRLTEVGVDYAFDAVGHSALVDTGIAATCPGGATVIVGAAPIDHVSEVNLVGLLFAEKQLMGSLLGSSHAPRDFPMLIDLWRNGRLDLDSMVTRRRPLEEVNEAIDDMRAGVGIRTVLQVS